jgi:putative methylase
VERTLARIERSVPLYESLNQFDASRKRLIQAMGFLEPDMKKVQLERILQGLESVDSPRSETEQYATPASIASEVAYLALAKGDILGARVLDAGCGNGVLAIGAKLLGATQVVAIDLDADVLRVARSNGQRAGVDVDWRQQDVASLEGAFETVLTNPPFGAQRRHADRPFIDKALQVSRVVYSFHNAVTEAYVRSRIEARGGTVTDRIEYEFPIPRTFAFHRQDVRRIPVVLLRSEGEPLRA